VGIMLAGFLSVIIRSVLVQGGVLNIVSDSHHGGRLNFWDFDMNPLRRHTFWTLTIGGTFIWVSVYGINQAQVQRYISCKSLANARLSLYLNLIGLLVIVVCTVFAGLCLYSIYKNCDPWTAGLVSKPDQLMPYLAMDILRVYPGLPGLFVAAAYSGSLSTVSSSINALAAVTVEDLIKPHIHMSEKRLSWISKGLSECDFQLIPPSNFSYVSCFLKIYIPRLVFQIHMKHCVHAACTCCAGGFVRSGVWADRISVAGHRGPDIPCPS
uniref:Solute carrier family 5 member 8 n=1 Tax=Myripristis murdjan TaxID=586833 RepID=A0A668AAY3_9TELE